MNFAISEAPLWEPLSCAGCIKQMAKEVHQEINQRPGCQESVAKANFGQTLDSEHGAIRWGTSRVR